MKKVSVIIPSFERAHLLKKTLPSYFQPEVGEVILINDGSKDNTREIVTEIQKEFPSLKYFELEKNSGQTVAKNKGIEAVNFEYVYFGDDDSYITEDTIRILLKTIVEQKADVVGARAIYLNEKFQPFITKGKLIDLDNNFSTNFSLDTEEVMEVPFLQACTLVKFELIKNVRFDDRFQGNGLREETDFFVRLNKLGAKILYQPKAVQINFPRSISTGGSWKVSAIQYVFYSIKNHFLFLDLHWEYLKDKYMLNRSKIQMKIMYIWYQKEPFFLACLKLLGLYNFVRLIYRKFKN